MIKKFFFVLESIILPYIMSIYIQLTIFCDDYCQNFCINNQPLGHIDESVHNDNQTVGFYFNLREDQIETFSVEVKNERKEGGLSLTIEIGDLFYSTNLFEYWKWNQTREFNVIYDEGRTKDLAAFLSKNYTDVANEIYKYTFTIPKLIKLEKFEINISKNKQFSFPLKNYINRTEQDIKSIIFTLSPDHGTISSTNSGTINIGQGYEPNDKFEYKKNKDINLKNVLGNNNIIDHITIYIKGKNKDLSNKATIYLIYCYKYEDVINYNIDITHCNSKYFNSCNSLCIDSCKQEGMVLFKKACYLECPEKYSFYYSNNICIEQKIKENKFDGISYVEKDLNELIEYLEDTFKAYKDIDAKMYGENYYFEIVPSKDSTTTNQKNISSINLGECEDILKEKYRIFEVYVAKIDIITSDPLNQVEYMAFDSEGNKLDLDYCKGQKITVEIPLKNNADMVSRFSKEGIDILNLESPFYNDRCFPYKSEKGDIILKDRRELFYQQINTEDGCSYSSFNNNKVSLKCDVKGEFSYSKRSSKIPTFENEVDHLSVMLFTCYNVLTFENLKKKNYGLWACGGVFVVKITLFTYFSCSGFQKFKTKLPIPNPPKVKTKRKPFGSRDSTLGKSSDLSFNSVIKEENNDPKPGRCLADSLRNIPLNASLAKKNPFRTFWIILLIKIRCYTVILSPGYFSVFSFSISIFLLTFMINFWFNAFFFSEELISQKYRNGGKIKTTTKIILPFLSDIASVIIHILLQKLGNFAAVFELIKGKDYVPKKSVKAYKIYLGFMKFKIILYYILEFLFVGFITYYLTIFCIVYPGSQFDWLINCSIGMLISLIYVVSVSFILSVIRSLALCFGVKSLFYGAVYLEK